MLADTLANLTKLASRNDVLAALRDLLATCARATGAAAGAILLLDLSESAYVESATFPPRQGARRLVKLVPPATDGDPLLLLAARRRKLLNMSPSGFDEPDPAHAQGHDSRLLVPMIQDNVCVGVIDLRTSRAGFSHEHEQVLRFAAGMALMLSEKEYTLNLLATLHTPIAYEQPHDEFLDEIMIQVADAARMPYIVLRRLSEGSLRCHTAYGIRTDPTALDIDSIADNPPFERAIRERLPQVENRVDQPYVQRLLGKLNLQDLVKSFIVVPILVGKAVYGTLSFAVTCPHSYTELEKHGLTMIANAVGVALANYENFHRAQARVYEEATISAAITTVDVAQSARHEARNLIQNSLELLAVLRAQKIIPARLNEKVKEITTDLSESLYGIDQELQKIKAVTKPPQRERTRCHLDQLWRDAFSLVAGRLKTLDVKYTITGSASATVAVDYMKHAFLNLILNSIDAFQCTKRRKGRAIAITIDERSPKAKDALIRFTDNATGIDPYSLRPTPTDEPRSVVDVFESGVTSKREGSGYGLYLARKILTEHHGSIDLVDHTGGVVFDITLPKEP